MSNTAGGDAAAQPAAAALTAKPAYERAEFLSSYYVFCQATDRIYQEVLMIRKLPVETYQLWVAVRHQGGHQQVQLRKLWAATARAFNHPKSWTNASHYFRTTYESAGLAELEDLVDSGQFSITLHMLEQQQQQQQQLTFGQNPVLNGSTEAAGQYHTGPAVPISPQQPPPHAGSLSYTSSQDDVRQESSSLVSSGSGFGAVVHQQKSNPYAAMKLAVRCGTARGIFDIPRQRVTCYCMLCTSNADSGVEMMPTEFERHGGCGSFKKWKKSIIVEETGRNLGVWLNQHGVVIMSLSVLTKKVKKRQLDEALAANRAAGNFTAAARAAAAAGGLRNHTTARGMAAAHTSAAVAGAATTGCLHQQQQQQQLWKHQTGFESSSMRPLNAAAPVAGAEHFIQCSVSHDFQTSSDARHQSHCWAPHRQQYDLAQRQYSSTQHDMIPHVLTSNWDTAHHQTNNPNPDRSGPGLSHRIPSSSVINAHRALHLNAMYDQGPGLRAQHMYEGFALVGRRIRVWWPLDRTWYSAAIEAYNTQLQLHMLLYDDGDLEQLDLAEEEWELVTTPAPTGATATAAAGVHKPGLQEQLLPGSPLSGGSTGTLQPPGDAYAASPTGTAAAAAAPAAVGRHGLRTAPMEVDGTPAAATNSPEHQYDCTAERQYSPAGVNRHEEQAVPAGSDSDWVAAAEAAAAARPLRVMWDSHAGLMRVIAAADLLVAEKESRRQQRHMQQHKQQQRQKQRSNWQQLVTNAAGSPAPEFDVAANNMTATAGTFEVQHPQPHAPASMWWQQQHQEVPWQQQACEARHKGVAAVGDSMPPMAYHTADLQQQQQQVGSCVTAPGRQQAPQQRLLSPTQTGVVQLQQQQQQCGLLSIPTGSGSEGGAVSAMINRREPAAVQQQQQHDAAHLVVHAAPRGPELPGIVQETQQQQRQHGSLGIDVTSTDDDNMMGMARCQLQVCVQCCQDSPGYEVLAMLPGYHIQDVRIKAWDDGWLLIKAAKQYSSTTADPGSAQPEGAGQHIAAAACSNSQDAALGMGDASGADTGAAAVFGCAGGLYGGGSGCLPEPVEKLVQLPGRIDCTSANALMTCEGQLFVRVNAAEVM